MVCKRGAGIAGALLLDHEFEAIHNQPGRLTGNVEEVPQYRYEVNFWSKRGLCKGPSGFGADHNQRTLSH